MKTIAAALSLGTLICGTLCAQEPPTPTPLPEHEWLQQLVGEWDIKSKGTMPDGTTIEVEFTETVVAVGDLWIRGEMRGDFGGQPFMAQLTLGYDPAKEAFVGTWIDTTNSHMWVYRGKLDGGKDAAASVLTLEAEGPRMDDPSKTAKYRDTIALDAAGRRYATSSVLGDDGEWVRFSTAEYRRKTKTETATFAGGCFWCIEAVLDRLDGVTDVESGYMGGHTDNPTYKEICNGDTGHAEVVQVQFDPKVISYTRLLGYFFAMHDPTTLNRQGNDVGTQYRSAIFYHSDEQKAAALAAIKKAQGAFERPIVTEVTKSSKLWAAEDYHQDYWAKNPNDRYCNAFIPSKLKKLGLDK